MPRRGSPRIRSPRRRQRLLRLSLDWRIDAGALVVPAFSFVKWTIYNANGASAKIEARRSYPRGLNDRCITLVATRKAIDTAEAKIGKPANVRIGTHYPIAVEAVEIQEGS